MLSKEVGNITFLYYPIDFDFSSGFLQSAVLESAGNLPGDSAAMCDDSTASENNNIGNPSSSDAGSSDTSEGPSVSDSGEVFSKKANSNAAVRYLNLWDLNMYSTAEALGDSSVENRIRVKLYNGSQVFLDEQMRKGVLYVEGTDGVLVRNDATASNIRAELKREEADGGFIREPQPLGTEPRTWLGWYRDNS